MLMQNLALVSFAGGENLPPFTLTPDSDVTTTQFNGGYASMDESPASDTDYAYSNDGQIATLEVGLSDPPHSPEAGVTTIRYRIARTNDGVVDGSGNSLTVTCHLYQGTTLIDSDTAKSATGSWTGHSFSPDMSSVSDWTALRLRFVTSSSGGSAVFQRGAGISWAVLEWAAN